MSLLDGLLGVLDIIFDGDTLVRRKKLEFTGSVSVQDDPINARTVVDVQGAQAPLTIIDFEESGTVAVGTLARFGNQTGDLLTATLASGTAPGQRIGVIWLYDSDGNVTINMTNVEKSHGETIYLGNTGVRGLIFVWNRNGSEGPFKWWLESTINYPLPS